MKRLALLVSAVGLTALWAVAAPTVQYTREDSTAVTTLLAKARRQPAGTDLMIFFARQLTGRPYVAKTLEVNATERLVVNLRQLDCTTYVETVTALTLAASHGRYTFGGFCHYLQQLRYQRGVVSYPGRLHYFTSWIESNTAKGYVREISAPNPPFTAVQRVAVSYMTTHTQYYPMLSGHADWVSQIARTERQLTGRRYPYIPKDKILNSRLMRATVHSGDIIAILTSKRGLDTSHIGIAVWHTDGLHLLNASQIHGRVVEEPLTLRAYMRQHPSQTGIRVVRLKAQ